MRITLTPSLLLAQPPLTQSRGSGTAPLAEQIELHRDRMCRRDEDLRIESAVGAERFIEYESWQCESASGPQMGEVSEPGAVATGSNNSIPRVE